MVQQARARNATAVQDALTQAPNSAFIRAMMIPPNLPSIPRGRPNVRINKFRVALIDGSS